MKQPNTKIHWTAFAVTWYYHENGVAPRTVDLVTEAPNAPDFMADPKSISSRLGSLAHHIHKGQDFSNKQPLAAQKITGEDGNATKGNKNAYFPIKPTIEQMRQVGAPTELPDGTDVSDEFELPDDPRYVTDVENVEHETTERDVQWGLQSSTTAPKHATDDSDPAEIQSPTTADGVETEGDIDQALDNLQDINGDDDDDTEPIPAIDYGAGVVDTIIEDSHEWDDLSRLETPEESEMEPDVNVHI